jgi:nucleotide-binding universal stress UspA family protein
MSDVQKIRVATDFSEHADKAVGRAALLAKRLKPVSAFLVHSLESHRVRAIRSLLPVLASMQKHQQEETEQELAGLADRLQEETGIHFTVRLHEGDAAESVLDGVAADELIVLGSRGVSSLRTLAIGSTAERVVGRCRGSVLVVKKPAVTEYQKVLVAVDLSDGALDCLRLARQLAPNAELEIVHALPPLSERFGFFRGLADDDLAAYSQALRTESVEKMHDLLKAGGLSAEGVRLVIEHGYAGHLIREQADAVGADLVVIGRHDENTPHGWLIGRVTSHVLGECAADVLVVNLPD